MRSAICRRNSPPRCVVDGWLGRLQTPKSNPCIYETDTDGILYGHYAKPWGFHMKLTPVPAARCPRYNLPLNVNKGVSQSIELI